MGSLISEIIKEAVDSDSSVTFLLQKAYVVAKKLQLTNFEQWLKLELDGYYNDQDKIPDYRKVQCTLMGYNQHRGWEEVVFYNDNPTECQCSNENPSIVNLHYPISTFDLQDQKAGGKFMLSISPESQANLNEASNYDTAYAYQLGYPSAQSILSRVRIAVLDWALELEKQGILGEDMSFNDYEKQKAASSTTINNFFSGDVNNSQIQQNSNHSSQTIILEQNDIDSIKQLVSLLNDSIPDLPVEKDNIDCISEQLKVISKEMRAKEPKKSIISKCFSTVKNILVNVPTNLLVSGIISEIDKLGFL